MLKSFRIQNYPMSCYPVEPYSAPSKHRGAIDEQAYIQARTPPTERFLVSPFSPQTATAPTVLIGHNPWVLVRATHLLAGSLEPLPALAVAPIQALLCATWSALLVGLGAGAANALSAIGRSPVLALDCLRALRSSPHQGPLMKTLLAPLLAGSLLVLPTVAALASGCYGLSRGFRIGRQQGLNAALRDGLQGIQKFHREAASLALQAVVDALRDSNKLALPL